MFLYYISNRLGWRREITVTVGAFISLILFMGGSTLLYLDIVDWPLPPTEGPVWMFHTNYTGIAKADFPLSIAVFMLLLYPSWQIAGFLVARRMDTGSFLLPLVSYDQVKSRRVKPETQFVVKRGGSPRKLTREAVEALGGIGRFVEEGARVLIKPNICGGNPQIHGSFTRIEVVDKLVDMIRGVNAEPIVVDSDMIWTKFKPVADAQGWKEWAQKKGVTLKNLRQTRRARFDFGEGSAIGVVPVSLELVEADVIISVPAMKTHLLTDVTLGMKNMYGTFPEENKAKYHRFGIENVIYEVNRAFTPHLTIIDGTIGGEAYGPLSCRPLDFKTIIASNDVVAADSVACILMGYDPFVVEHIKKAHERDLGKADVTFDPSSLDEAHEKDGNWERPDPEVTKFYEGLVEVFLQLPGMQNVFDIAADFVLFGMATLPILRDLTPALESVMDDVLGGLIRSGYRSVKLADEGLNRIREILRIET
ncbi:MAG: DUF362 domain-containing protein [Candidatus Bathyarchaeota archaeon]|nr:MAG: DUF362 domain-containing protein [Candidatus Bathyarchaeota archaeon]